MAVGDLYRCALTFRIHGQVNTNVMYMKNLTAIADDNAEKSATTVLPYLVQAYRLIIAGIGFDKAFQLDANLISRINSDLGAESVIADVAYANNVALPTVNAIVASIYTGLSGPTRRGRLFLGGVAVDSVLNSVIAGQGPARYAGWTTAMANAFLGSEPASGYQLGVFSRKRYEILSNPFDEYWKPATAIQVKNPVATMHSRKLGVGS